MGRCGNYWLAGYVGRIRDFSGHLKSANPEFCDFGSTLTHFRCFSSVTLLLQDQIPSLSFQQILDAFFIVFDVLNSTYCSITKSICFLWYNFFCVSWPAALNPLQPISRPCSIEKYPFLANGESLYPHL